MRYRTSTALPGCQHRSSGLLQSGLDGLRCAGVAAVWPGAGLTATVRVLGRHAGGVHQRSDSLLTALAVDGIVVPMCEDRLRRAEGVVRVRGLAVEDADQTLGNLSANSTRDEKVEKNSDRGDSRE